MNKNTRLTTNGYAVAEFELNGKRRYIIVDDYDLTNKNIDNIEAFKRDKDFTCVARFVFTGLTMELERLNNPNITGVDSISYPSKFVASYCNIISSVTNDWAEAQSIADKSIFDFLHSTCVELIEMQRAKKEKDIADTVSSFKNFNKFKNYVEGERTVKEVIMPLLQNQDFVTPNKNDEVIFKNFYQLNDNCFYNNETTGVKELVKISMSTGKGVLSWGAAKDFTDYLCETLKPMLDSASEAVSKYILSFNNSNFVDMSFDKLKNILGNICPSFIMNNMSIKVYYHEVTENDEDGNETRKIIVLDGTDLVCTISDKPRFNIIEVISPYLQKHILEFVSKNVKAFSNTDKKALNYVKLPKCGDGSVSVEVPKCISDTFGVRTSNYGLHLCGAFLYKCSCEKSSGRQSLILFNKGRSGTSSFIDVINMVLSNNIKRNPVVIGISESAVSQNFGLQACLAAKVIAIKDISKPKEVIDSGVWRSLSANETVQIDIKNSNPVQFNPNGLQLVLTTNKTIYTQDAFTNSRICPVKFSIPEGESQNLMSQSEFQAYIAQFKEEILKWGSDCYKRLEYLGLVHAEDFVIVEDDKFTQLDESNEKLSPDEYEDYLVQWNGLKAFDNDFLVVNRKDSYAEFEELDEARAVTYIVDTVKDNYSDLDLKHPWLCKQSFKDLCNSLAEHSGSAGNSFGGANNGSSKTFEKNKKSFKSLLTWDRDGNVISDWKLETMWKRVCSKMKELNIKQVPRKSKTGKSFSVYTL